MTMTVLAGKYRLGERIGEGGMGVVHAGHHLALDTAVAVKLLHDDEAKSTSGRSRFVREARRAASIQGEHSVRIYDVGEEPTPHIVMEMLVGENAAERLERVSQFSVADATTLMLQVLDALAEAHGRGLVHRDLKPANIFLADRPGEPIWVKILDFGIAKDVTVAKAGAPTVTELTAPHTMIGSPEYMAPEQLRGEAVDARSDLWSCGVVLYELLSGRTPFSGSTLADLGAKIIGTEPAPLPSNVPSPVARMIERCLRKEPAARPQNAYDLAAALAPFASPEARGLLPRIRTWCKADAPAARAPTLARKSTVAGGLALVVGAGILAFVAASPKETQAPVAKASALEPPPTVSDPASSAVPSAPSALEPDASPALQADRPVPSTTASSRPPSPVRVAPTSTPNPTNRRIQSVKDIELLP